MTDKTNAELADEIERALRFEGGYEGDQYITRQERVGLAMLPIMLDIIAALRHSERDPMEDFRKGRESVLRKNQSVCCCLFNEEDEVVSVCMAHKEWAERQPSSDQVLVPITVLDRIMRDCEYGSRIWKECDALLRQYRLAAAEAEGR